MYNYELASPTLTECDFTGNSGDGAGMANYNASPQLFDCNFIMNAAGDEEGDGVGGGMFNVVGSAAALTRCAFISNSAGFAAGGFLDSDSGSVLIDCTLHDNSAWYGGGAWADVNATTTLINCGFFAGTPDDDVNLSAGSPAIDVGSTAALPPDAYDMDADLDTAEPIPLDYDGNPRRLGASVDIGAQEAVPLIPGDLNGNGFVAADDRSAFESCGSGPEVPHNDTSPCEAADLDGDNDVDARDHGIFQGCCSGFTTPADPICAD